MGRSADKDATSKNAGGDDGASGTGRRGHGHLPAQDDPHDEIDRELLGIWMGLARLHEKLLEERRAAQPRRLMMQRSPRRKAA